MLSITASIGITLYPADSAAPDMLLRHADQAMYLAKQSGRNRFHLFDPQHDERARAHRELVERMRAGLVAGEFCLFYQPKVDMRRGQVVGFEGLIRWRHPDRGLLAPAEFLPVIDSTPVEVDVGRWVLGEGLRQLVAWRRAGLRQQLSLNIAASHLLMPGFADELEALLKQHGELEREALELEILETAALEDLEQAAAVFERCRALGVRIALDDFGTGYSSLSYFRRLPTDTLKIDQTFIRAMLENPEDLAIVQSVIGLTQAFHRNLVAEGVESPELGALLIQIGCDVGQGYGIARPMPAAAVENWVAGFRPDTSWSVRWTRWSAEDLPLVGAEIEHKRWVAELRDWLGQAAAAAADLPVDLDSRTCRFGRWYYGVARRRYADRPGYARIGALHEAVHRLGNELAALRRKGHESEIAARQAELAPLHEAMVGQLHILQAQILMGAETADELPGEPVQRTRTGDEQHE